jgi:hypothetical protein
MFSPILVWIQSNPQLVSALIAGFAFVIALAQFALARKHNRTSVRPLLLHVIKQSVFPIMKGNLSGPAVATERVLYSEWSFVVSNRGLGPAIVEECTFALDEKCFRLLNQEAIEESLRTAFPDPAVRPKPTYSSIVAGTVIGKDTEISVLKLCARNPEEASELTRALSKSAVDFVLRFRTLYDEKFLYDTRSVTGQKRVRWWNRF